MTRAEIIEYMRGLQSYRGKLNAKWKDRLHNEIIRLGAIMTAMDVLFGTNWKIELQ